MISWNPCLSEGLHKSLLWVTYKRSWCPLPWSPTHAWPRLGLKREADRHWESCGSRELLPISSSSLLLAWANCQLSQCLGPYTDLMSIK